MDRAREAERARQTQQEIPGFGVLLRKHRLDAGLTQDALAERAQISVRAIADLERGARRYPYAETTARLAAALDLTHDQGDVLTRASRRLKTRAAVTYLHAPDRVGLRGATVSAVRRSRVDPPNLPEQLTSFIGRAEELEQVMAVAPEPRLLTLTGPGGVGKTRLAIELARHLHARDYDAVYFLDLAPLHDAVLVQQAVVAALGGRQDASEPVVDTIRSLLGGGRTLLLLDNCEHLVETVAHLVDLLLREIATLSVLATSREPLGVRGEARWAVPPLGETDSVRLFVERARLVDARFAPAGGDAAEVMQLCRTLDGLPLAIELAAGPRGAVAGRRDPREIGEAVRATQPAGAQYGCSTPNAGGSDQLES